MRFAIPCLDDGANTGGFGQFELNLGIGQSATIEVVGRSPEDIISEIRNRASTLFKKFTISEISYSWAGANTKGKNLWVGKAHVIEDI